MQANGEEEEEVGEVKEKMKIQCSGDYRSRGDDQA
jgi:hypothetical protein